MLTFQLIRMKSYDDSVYILYCLDLDLTNVMTCFGSIGSAGLASSVLSIQICISETRVTQNPTGQV
jgi:hypothetical protein